MATSNFSLQHQNHRQLKYKKKARRIKKLIKYIVFENAALCDQVAQIQNTILCVKEERRFLMKKLVEHDPELLADVNATTTTVFQTTGDGTLSGPMQPMPRKTPKKRANLEGGIKGKPGPKPAKQKKQQQQFIQTISVDQMGHPIYPIHMGNSLSLFDLGEIVSDRPGYHTEQWIYPVGYVSTRIYGHMKEPKRKCVYACKIIDDGDYPRFEVIPDSDMEYAIAGPSPDLCHAALLQTMNNSSDARDIDVLPQGEWFFGLGHPTVITLLQAIPNVVECANFIGFQNDALSVDRFNDPTINYDALQNYLGTSVYHTVPEIKEEPPEELLEQFRDFRLDSKNEFEVMIG